MVTNKTVLWIAVIMISGVFCAASAMAEVKRSEAYEGLTAVELAPSHAPRLINGVSELSGTERQHNERLPMQLEGAIKKIKKSKYFRKSLSREHSADF